MQQFSIHMVESSTLKICTWETHVSQTCIAEVNYWQIEFRKIKARKINPLKIMLVSRVSIPLLWMCRKCSPSLSMKIYPFSSRLKVCRLLNIPASMESSLLCVSVPTVVENVLPPTFEVNSTKVWLETFYTTKNSNKRKEPLCSKTKGEISVLKISYKTKPTARTCIYTKNRIIKDDFIK